MSVDGVGGSDAALAARRRQLEEERVRELERIEKNKKQEVERAYETRERQLRDLYINQELEAQGIHRDSEARLAKVRSNADARIRDFEDKSQRMTDEAKRQFQAKADMLNKNARELEEQRQYMLKQHEQSTRALEQQHERNEFERKNKLDREANEAYMRQLGTIQDTESRGQAELDLVRQELAQRKQAERAQSDLELDQIKWQKETNAEAMQRQIDFNKREGEEQLGRLRADMDYRQAHLQGEADERVRNLTRESQRQVNRTHQLGKRSVTEAQESYANQLEGMRKDNKKKTQEIQNRTALNLSAMESDAKTQEELARKGYSSTKVELAQAREKYLEEYRQKNSELQEKTAKDYVTQSQLLSKSRKEQISKQTEQAAAEIAAQKQYTQKRLNETTLSNAKKIAEHDAIQSDSFYQMHKIGAQVDDSPEAVNISVDVPAHEQDTVRITLQQGNSLTVSGSRKSEEKATTEAGHKVTSNSYQSYSESFPVRGKLEMNKMTRTYSDGRLMFRIPKG